MKHSVTVGGLLLLAQVLVACTETPPPLPRAPENTLRIVSSLPTKGLDASQSKLMREAIDMAIVEHTPPGGKWSVEHVALDSSAGENGSPSVSLESQNALRAASDPSVVAYIGPYTSGGSKAALPITNRAHLLELSPSATWPGLTTGGWDTGEPDAYRPSGASNFVRLIPSDAAQASAAVQWLVDAATKSAFVLSDGSSYSDGLAAQFIAAAASRGLALAGRGTFVASAKLQDLPQTVGAIFYAPSTTGNALQFAKALDSLPSHPRVVVTDTALDGQLSTSAASSLRQWEFLYNGVDQMPSAEWRQFASRFAARYSAQPSWFAANAYDAASLVLTAIASGATSRDAVLKKVLATQHYVGVTGDITFNTNGDRTVGYVSGYHVVGGHFAFDRLLSVAP